MAESANRVAIRIGERRLEISSADRDALLGRARQLTHPLPAELCHRIDSAGPSQPVEIYAVEELDTVSDFFSDWTRAGTAPEGIRVLEREVKAELDRLLGPE